MTEEKEWEIEPEYPDDEVPDKSLWTSFTVTVKETIIHVYGDVMAPNAFSATEMYDEYEDDVMNTYNEVINVEPVPSEEIITWTEWEEMMTR